MSILQRFDRHVELMNRMGDALGVDFETEMLSGMLRPEEYRDKVFRCTSCRNADDCSRLLETSGGSLVRAPEYCRNRADFDARAID